MTGTGPAAAAPASGYHASVPPGLPKRSYVVACTPRTGSSLLCAALAGTGVAGNPAEHVVPGEKRVPARLRKVMMDTATENGVFGIKLFWHQFAFAMRDLRRRNREHRTSSVGALAAVHLGDPRWVHLYRRDTAAQAVSYFRAIYSGVSRVEPGRPLGRKPAPEDVDLTQIAWLEDLLVVHERRWRGFFQRAGITPVEVAYEDLDSAYGRTVRRVLRQLGLKAPAGSLAGPRPLRRQEDAAFEALLAEYRAHRPELRPQPRSQRWSNMDVLSARRVGPVEGLPARAREGRPVPAPPSVRYSCVVDTHPRFEQQSLIWALTLINGAKRPASDLVVHAIKGVRKSHVARLEELGVAVVPVERWPLDNPYSNKLRQFESPVLDADIVVLSDCDLAFHHDPSDLLPREAIGAKAVDGGAPLYHVWVNLLEVAGLDTRRMRLGRATQGLRFTYANNLNGGFLSVPAEHFAALGDAWARWFSWTLGIRGGPWRVGNRSVRFGRIFNSYIGQISFGLAMAELDPPVVTLPPGVNFTTKAPFIDWGGVVPSVFHYHRQLDERGLLKRTGVPTIDEGIDAVNAVLTTEDAKRLLAQSTKRWRKDLEANG